MIVPKRWALCSSLRPRLQKGRSLKEIRANIALYDSPQAQANAANVPLR
jgi:hypothetical protein